MGSTSTRLTFRFSKADLLVAFFDSVITVGHSLGGAIAEREATLLIANKIARKPQADLRRVLFSLSVDALYLKLQIPSLSVSARLFGLPRTGNPAFGPWALSVVRNFSLSTSFFASL